MISFVKGELNCIYDTGIVIENGGIGYDIKVPLSVMNELPCIGEEVKIYTYLYVREDILCLYGFLSKDDLEVFKLLITVNGIGPKGALGILSTISPDDLRYAVLADDSKTIAKAPGIGAKTASKLILELKDKLSLTDVMEKSLSNVSERKAEANTDLGAKNEAIQALVALGYSSTEAAKAVRMVEMPPDIDAEGILKLALKKISIF